LVIKNVIKHKEGDPPRFFDNPKYPLKRIWQGFGQNPKDPSPGLPTTVHIIIIVNPSVQIKIGAFKSKQ
jgi:hypothetical protein